MKQALLAATTTPQHHHVQENEHDEDDEVVNGDVSRDLATDDSIVDPIAERRTLAERSERLHDQLKVRSSVDLKTFTMRVVLESIRFSFECGSFIIGLGLMLRGVRLYFAPHCKFTGTPAFLVNCGN